MSQPPQGRPEGQQPGQGPQQPGQGAPQQGRPPQGPQGHPPQGGPYGPQGGYPGRPGGYPPQGGQPQPGGHPYPGQQPYPGQPGPQGFAGGPYGPGPGPQGGGFGPGGPPPYGSPQQDGPKKRTGLFVLIGAAALALVLAVVAVAVNVGGGDDTAGGGSGSSGGGARTAPAGATASDAVTGYLEAVARGDAQAAVAYASDPAAVDTALMTPEVLAASAKLAPMTAISVPPVTDPDATSVPVSYRLGDTPVSTSIEVMRMSDDSWKLITVATDLDLSAYQDPEIPMLVNGAKVGPESFSVLPGTYRFTTGQRNFDYGSKADLVVRYPSDYPDTSRIQPQISSKGKAAALSALRKSWSSCLKSRDPKPGGCPNRWNNGSYVFKKGTVRWTRKGSDPVKKPQARDFSTYTVFSVKVDLALRGTCSSGGRTGTCTGTLGGGTALARAEYSADKVKLTWQT